MNKLSNEQLEKLVQKRNEKGLTRTVEVMNNEELALYRNNCIEAINKRKQSMSKYKEDSTMYNTLVETIEVLQDSIAYIDSKLNQTETNVIENFINEWERQAVEYYTQLLSIPYKQRVEMVRKGELTKSDLQITTHTNVELIKEHIKLEANKRLNKLYQQINNKVGDIVSINLKSNSKHGFDGIIKGSEATIRIETILAGGDNIQCLHYRTLVKVITE